VLVQLALEAHETLVERTVGRAPILGNGEPAAPSRRRPPQQKSIPWRSKTSMLRGWRAAMSATTVSAVISKGQSSFGASTRDGTRFSFARSAVRAT
jgi:hypothetical protein